MPGPAIERIAAFEHLIRDESVILDSDLAGLYGVEPRALNQAVSRNGKRFPRELITDCDEFPPRVLPELPTLSEAGLTGFAADNWFGVMAPAGTPAAIVTRLNADLMRAIDSAEVKQIVARQGGELRSSTPGEMAAQISSDREKWGKVVRESGARIK